MRTLLSATVLAAVIATGSPASAAPIQFYGQAHNTARGECVVAKPADKPKARLNCSGDDYRTILLPRCNADRTNRCFKVGPARIVLAHHTHRVTSK